MSECACALVTSHERGVRRVTSRRDAPERASGAEAEAAAPLRHPNCLEGERERHGRPNVTSPRAQGILALTRAAVPGWIAP
jgi:hypothetical protein